jgi:hypothetical protein
MSDTLFDKLGGEAAVKELNVSQELITEVVAICETTRNDVLGR